jgi:hypothetical protein
MKCHRKYCIEHAKELQGRLNDDGYVVCMCGAKGNCRWRDERSGMLVPSLF